MPKYAILAEHCAAVGRDFTEIERTNMQGVGLGSAGAWSHAPESPDAIVERFGRLAEAGVQHVIVNFAEANDPALIELLGSRVLPQLRDVEAADPRAVASGRLTRWPMSWQALADAAPELAAFGAGRLHDQVAYLATLKADGSPRLHPVRPVVAAGRLFVFMEATSPKVRDLERDTRFALHATATSDQPWDLREFGVEGTARRVDDRNAGPSPSPGRHSRATSRFLLYELSVGSAFSTSYGADGNPQRQRWRAT